MSAMMRRRPTISLVVMSLLGLLWCGLWSEFRGDTPWEPNDKGWFAGWIAYYVLTGAVLVYLWWKRVRAWVIVTTPIASTVLTLALVLIGLVPDTSADLHDTSTFIDGFWPVLLWGVVAAGIAALIGAVVLRSQNPTHVAESREHGR